MKLTFTCDSPPPGVYARNCAPGLTRQTAPQRAPRAHHPLVCPAPPLGVALIFIPAGGGRDPSPLLPPLDPLPPPPSALIHLRIRVLGTFFRLGQFFPPAPLHLEQGYLVTPLYPFFPLLQTPCPSVP